MGEAVESFKRAIRALFQGGVGLDTGFAKVCSGHLATLMIVRQRGQDLCVCGPRVDMASVTRACLQRMVA
eukprot:7628188-Lingulodinium_polyedra.AAC.1